MPQTPSEARRAEQIERAGGHRLLTQEELDEYVALALASARRVKTVKPVDHNHASRPRRR
ncbi:MAG: hypothetical protein Tp170SUR191951_25 [Prokaryotic dsDNA virus sp.]|nr:MAG: hypothetical protein Tp170SUR191951_25 [Prokaryotic dsDNA virus sp.]|tara:strand:- start:1038 stop:1217 length:180 start_codon:yes stop_codon:yes gene_type:complete